MSSGGSGISTRAGLHRNDGPVEEIVLPDLDLLDCLSGVHQQQGVLTLTIG
jgi:hypothetical protein